MRAEIVRSDERVRALAGRLKQWRQTFGGRGRRLPEFVWRESAELIDRHGLEVVARLLGVAPERLSTKAGVVRVPFLSDPPPAFTDLGPVGPPPCGATVEIEGSKIVIRWPAGTTAEEIAAAVCKLIESRR